MQEFHSGTDTVVSSFIDSGAGLVPSTVRSSPGIKQVYNGEANNVGPVQ